MITIRKQFKFAAAQLFSRQLPKQMQRRQDNLEQTKRTLSATSDLEKPIVLVRRDENDSMLEGGASQSQIDDIVMVEDEDPVARIVP